VQQTPTAKQNIALRVTVQSVFAARGVEKNMYNSTNRVIKLLRTARKLPRCDDWIKRKEQEPTTTV